MTPNFSSPPPLISYLSYFPFCPPSLHSPSQILNNIDLHLSFLLFEFILLTFVFLLLPTCVIFFFCPLLLLSPLVSSYFLTSYFSYFPHPYFLYFLIFSFIFSFFSLLHHPSLISFSSCSSFFPLPPFVFLFDLLFLTIFYLHSFSLSYHTFSSSFPPLVSHFFQLFFTPFSLSILSSLFSFLISYLSLVSLSSFFPPLLSSPLSNSPFFHFFFLPPLSYHFSSWLKVWLKVKSVYPRWPLRLTSSLLAAVYPHWPSHEVFLWFLPVVPVFTAAHRNYFVFFLLTKLHLYSFPQEMTVAMVTADVTWPKQMYSITFWFWNVSLIINKGSWWILYFVNFNAALWKQGSAAQ